MNKYLIEFLRQIFVLLFLPIFVTSAFRHFFCLYLKEDDSKKGYFYIDVKQSLFIYYSSAFAARSLRYFVSFYILFLNKFLGFIINKLALELTVFFPKPTETMFTTLFPFSNINLLNFIVLHYF